MIKQGETPCLAVKLADEPQNVDSVYFTLKSGEIGDNKEISR